MPLAESVVDGKGWKLQSAFETIFLANGGPPDAAMFTNDVDVDSVIYYFSPGALRIAGNLLTSYGAVPCSRPVRDSVALLVGEQSALDALPAPKPDRS